MSELKKSELELEEYQIPPSVLKSPKQREAMLAAGYLIVEVKSNSFAKSHRVGTRVEYKIRCCWNGAEDGKKRPLTFFKSHQIPIGKIRLVLTKE